MAKKEVKKTAKELKEERSRRLMQIGLALFLVVIMVMAVFQVFFSGSRNNVTPGNTDKNQFESIADALKSLPTNAKYVRFADLNGTNTIRGWVTSNFYGNIANATLFGAAPSRDAFAIYPFPTFGYFDESQQWVMLSDLGKGFDNASFTSATYNGYPMRIISSPYAFSPSTYPVVIGRKEAVAVVDSIMSGNTAGGTAYADFADVLAKAAATNATPAKAEFAVVGTGSSIGFGDRYYAGVAPVNEMASDYTIVVHLASALNLTQQQAFQTTYRDAALEFGLDSFEPQFTDDFLIIEARGDTIVCLYDMVTNWPGFIQEIQYA